MDDPSQANPRERLRKIIHAEIKSLEESIQAHYGDTSTALKYRRNAPAPISTLPAEVIAAIFSFLRRPAASSLRGKPERDLLRVTHVCHQWREIALEQPLLWSRVDCTNLTLAGVREILAQAKNAPLHLEARFHGSHWKEDRFGTFEKEILLHISHIRRLGIGSKTGQVFHLLKILEGLTSSPAPTLEYFSLINGAHKKVSIPDTFFDSTTPRLFSLELRNCDISWKSYTLGYLWPCSGLCTPTCSSRPTSYHRAMPHSVVR